MRKILLVLFIVLALSLGSFAQAETVGVFAVPDNVTAFGKVKAVNTIIFNKNTGELLKLTATSTAIDTLLTATTTPVSVGIPPGDLVLTGDLLPDADNTRSIGSDLLRWAEGWFFGSTLNIGDSTNNVAITNIGLTGTALYTGSASGQDDMTVSGTLGVAGSADFMVWPDGSGTPDTFSWSVDGVTIATGVSMIGGDTPQFLENGIYVAFTSNTGHNPNKESWTFGVGHRMGIDKAVRLANTMSVDGEMYVAGKGNFYDAVGVNADLAITHGELVVNHDSDDTSPIATMINDGDNPGEVEFYTGDRDPDGLVDPGGETAVYYRSDGAANSGVYVNLGGGINDWDRRTAEWSSDGTTLTTVDSGINVRIDGGLAVYDDTTIFGNLNVQGTNTSIDSAIMHVFAPYGNLNSGYTGTAEVTGGVTVVIQTSTPDTVATGGFTAGVASTSNPTIITTGSATYTTSDIVQITNADNVANNGLYEVLSHVSTTLIIRGIGVTTTVEAFSGNQFVTDATVAGDIRKATLSVAQAGALGWWEQGTGDTTPITYTPYLSIAGNDTELQFNNSGVLGASSNLTWNGSSLGLAGILDLGTNTIADSYMTGRWSLGTTDAPKINLHVVTGGTSALGTIPLNRGIAITSSEQGSNRFYRELTSNASGTRVGVNTYSTDGWTWSFMNDSAGGSSSIGSSLAISASTGLVNVFHDFQVDNDLFMLDNGILSLGTGNDLQIWHDATDTNILNTTGDLVIENSSVTSDIVMELGTNTNAVNFIVKDQSNNLFVVDGAGDATVAGDISVGGIIDPGVVTGTSLSGILWGNDTSYGIYRSAGAWSPDPFKQLNMKWITGIVIDGGNLYGNSGISLSPNGGTVSVGGDLTLASGTVTATTFSGDLSGTINTATTGVTQSAGDNSTLIATTAYADSAIGAVSYWGKAGAVLSPLTAGDAIATTGDIDGGVITGTDVSAFNTNGPTYINIDSTPGKRLRLGYTANATFADSVEDNVITAQINVGTLGDLKISSRTNAPSDVVLYTCKTTAAIEGLRVDENQDVFVPNGDLTITSGTVTATTFSGDLNGTINTLTTGATQSAGDGSTKIATCLYSDTAATNVKIADGTTTNGTLRWNGSDWVQSTVLQVGTETAIFFNSSETVTFGKNGYGNSFTTDFEFNKEDDGFNKSWFYGYNANDNVASERYFHWDFKDNGDVGGDGVPFTSGLTQYYDGSTEVGTFRATSATITTGDLTVTTGDIYAGHGYLTGELTIDGSNLYITSAVQSSIYFDSTRATVGTLGEFEFDNNGSFRASLEATLTDFANGYTDLKLTTKGSDGNVARVVINEAGMAVTGLIGRSLATAITASTTQTQGQQPLTKNVNNITIIANDNDVVTLPAALATTSHRIVIYNSDATETLQIFPASGDDLGAGVNASTTLAPGANVSFGNADATNWRTE